MAAFRLFRPEFTTPRTPDVCRTPTRPISSTTIELGSGTTADWNRCDAQILKSREVHHSRGVKIAKTPSRIVGKSIRRPDVEVQKIHDAAEVRIAWQKGVSGSIFGRARFGEPGGQVVVVNQTEDPYLPCGSL